MRSKDLEVLDQMPFFAWAKDEEGTYLWVNRALAGFAGKEMVGKTDRELPWTSDAATLRAEDKQVLETQKTLCGQVHIAESSHGAANLSYCKFAGELDGKKCTLGVSFIVE